MLLVLVLSISLLEMFWILTEQTGERMNAFLNFVPFRYLTLPLALISSFLHHFIFLELKDTWPQIENIVLVK